MAHPSSAQQKQSVEVRSPDFDRKRLAHELLSLGNPKITPTIAELISKEVDQELREAKHRAITAEVVSDLVRFKLEELGLIEIKSIRPRLRKNQTEKAMKTIHPFTPLAEVRDVSPRTPPLRAEAKPTVFRPSKAKLQWSEEGCRAFSDLKPGESPETFLKNLSEAVARIDKNYDPTSETEGTALHFFNRMMSLDFIPGNPVLTTDLKTGRAAGAAWGLSLKLDSSNLYESLRTIDLSSAETANGLPRLGIDLADSKASGLFLGLLKTTLEHHHQSTGRWIRQDLFLKVPTAPSENAEPPSPSPFSEILNWLSSEDHRLYFSLSFGVSGRLFDSPPPENGSNGRETRGTQAPDPLIRGLEALQSPKSHQGPGTVGNLQSLRDFESLVTSEKAAETNPRPAVLPDLGPDTLEGLIRILKKQLSLAPNLRLFFLERAEEGLQTPQVRADRVPTPVSPALHYSGEIIPSAYLNLAALVEEEEISWDRLRRSVRQAVHFLDNVIDLWSYPNDESERISKANRSIALGVMGWADLLYILRIPYDSDEAVELLSRTAHFIREEAVAASSELAKLRGVFPNYIGSVWQKRGIPVRNAQLTALIWDPIPSNIAQTAPGIEPHSILVAQSTSNPEKPQYLVHPFLAEVAQRRGFSTERTLHKIVESGSLQKVQEIPEDVRKVFATNEDIDWEWHLRSVHALEKNFDAGAAKLCPVKVPFEDGLLKQILHKANDLRLKSLWLKRQGEISFPPEERPGADGSRASDHEEEVTEVQLISEGALSRALSSSRSLRARPERLRGTTHQFKTTCGNLYITINEDGSGPFEIFSFLGKSTGCTASQNEALSKMITLAFRSGVDPAMICGELRESPCAGSRNGSAEGTPSCTEAMGQAIAYHFRSHGPERLS
jgi:ribonucleotide reductase-like protein